MDSQFSDCWTGRGGILCTSLDLHVFADAEHRAVSVEYRYGIDVITGGYDDGQLVHDRPLQQDIIYVIGTRGGEIAPHVLILQELRAHVRQAAYEIVHLIGHVGQTVLCLPDGLSAGNRQEYEKA